VPALKLLWLVVRTNPGALYAHFASLAAGGNLGSRVQKVYLYLIGKKTKSGAALGIAYLLCCVPCWWGISVPWDWCRLTSWMGDLSLALLAWGVVDGSARAIPPTIPTK
jgi:hypothetical protein